MMMMMQEERGTALPMTNLQNQSRRFRRDQERRVIGHLIMGADGRGEEGSETPSLTKNSVPRGRRRRSTRRQVTIRRFILAIVAL